MNDARPDRAMAMDTAWSHGRDLPPLNMDNFRKGA